MAEENIKPLEDIQERTFESLINRCGNSVLKGEKKVFKTLLSQTQKVSVQLKQKIAIAADFILRNKLEENDTAEFNIEKLTHILSLEDINFSTSSEK